MAEEERRVDKEVLFNLGSEHLKLIGFLLKKASISCMNGDILGYFRTLRQLKSKISQRLNKTEVSKLNLIEQKAFSIMDKYKPVEEETITAEEIRENKRAQEVMPCLIIYDEHLMQLLEVKGYLVPLKQDRTSVFGRKSAGEI